jgi:hypothetical protein
MTTTEHKDRVTVIGVLAGEPVGHCVGDHAIAHPDLGVNAREVLRRVSNGEPVREGADAELVALSNDRPTTRNSSHFGCGRTRKGSSVTRQRSCCTTFRMRSRPRVT